MTALSLVRYTYQVKAGDWVLVHAAAGGTGQLITQLASQLGAHVIGTVSTQEKADLAKVGVLVLGPSCPGAFPLLASTNQGKTCLLSEQLRILCTWWFAAPPPHHRHTLSFPAVPGRRTHHPVHRG